MAEAKSNELSPREAARRFLEQGPGKESSPAKLLAFYKSGLQLVSDEAGRSAAYTFARSMGYPLSRPAFRAWMVRNGVWERSRGEASSVRPVAVSHAKPDAAKLTVTGELSHAKVEPAPEPTPGEHFSHAKNEQSPLSAADRKALFDKARGELRRKDIPTQTAERAARREAEQERAGKDGIPSF